MQLDSADLLTDQDLATKFWNTVSEEQTVAIKTKDSQRDIEGDIGTGYGKLHECLRIIIFFDEASALLDKCILHFVHICVIEILICIALPY